jgi:glutamyl/glutaminyl-tRNA synthetase
LLDEAGSKLSKRDMSLSMSMFRRSGASPNDLIARMMQTIGALEEGVEAVTAAECVVLLSSRANWNDGIWRS